METFITKSEEDTRALAKRVAYRLKGGAILLLQGELGAGKTTFVQGLARALGIKEKIKSPTFVLMHVHQTTPSPPPPFRGRIKVGVRYLVHGDAYRVKSAEALKEVGLMDWIGRPDTVVVVEWGEKIRPLLRGRRYCVVKFRHGKIQTERVIQISTPRQKTLLLPR